MRAYSELTLQDIQYIKSNASLGKGSYGEVDLARVVRGPLTGKLVAVKKIAKASIKSEHIAATLKREVDLHRRISHENIVQLYTACEDNENVYLIMEYAEKGNLFFIIRNQLA